MDEFPPNTKASKGKPAPEEKPEPEKIVTGPVIKRKKPLGTKFKEVIGGDFKSASRYVVAEVILPSVRNLIVDAGIEGLKRVVFGGERDRQTRRSSSSYGSRVMYNSPVVRRDPREEYSSAPRSISSSSRPKLEQLIITDRGEAEAIIEQLIDIADKYQFASVADLYKMLGFSTTFVDGEWGWSSLVDVSIKQIREGWLIELPDPEPK